MNNNTITVGLSNKYIESIINYWPQSKIWNSSYLYNSSVYNWDANNTASMNITNILYLSSKCRLCKRCSLKRKKKLNH